MISFTRKSVFLDRSRAIALILTLIGLVFSVTLLSACASQGESPSSSAESEGQAATISATVSIAAVEDAGFSGTNASVSLPEGSTVYDALVASETQIDAAEAEYGMFVSAIAGVENSDSSGWVYTVNGEQVMDACDDFVLSDGDVVEWSYTTW